ncbi:MAG: hypothetical protein OEU54_00790 [Gemmatimonadota bacterium]|nr:hypothetical protein [Gemmatimonadota bacterium]
MGKPDSRRGWKSLALVAIAVIVFSPPKMAAAQIAKFPPPQGATTHTVIPGERYQNGGLSRWFLGAGYRDIWAMPIEIPVLDMDTTYGGLTPVETGGYGQSFTLEFLGADGLEYAVRSLDKDPTRRLAPEFQGTVVAAIVQDQISAFLPSAGLIVDPLLDAAGLLYPRHTLVVVPDDPRLGEFREVYAGLVGMLVDRPQEGPDNTPGFAGSDRVSGTDNFLEHLEEGACNRADAREYLEARLIDMLIGDRDRHAGQWTWARFPEGDGCYVWRPIPEDRDQAFILHDGALMSMYRLARPQQTRFGPDHSSLLGITFNGWELDRQILVELDEPVWATVAEELREELTDEVIDAAVRRLPAGHYELVGEFIAASLKARRETLLPEALAYYRMISRAAEIKVTDRPELAVFEHHDNGNLTLTIRYLEGPRSDAPYFERTFYESTTDEVRLFLQGGDDQVEVIGSSGRIRVRAIGGGGDDRYENRSASSASMTRFYDDRGDNAFVGPATVDESSFERPPSANLVHRYATDWGSVKRIIPDIGYSPDLGLEIGFDASMDRYGFRKVPWASQHGLAAQISTIGPEFDAAWNSRWRESLGRGDFLLRAEYSGGNILRFHGFGNGTEILDEGEVIVGGETIEIDSDFYKVRQSEIVLAPAIEWSWGRWGARAPDEENRPEFRPEVRLGISPVLKHANAPADENEERFIGTLDPQPLGLGSFGQLGLEAWFEVDTRDKAGYPMSGFRLQSLADFWAAAWDAEDSFGGFTGALSGFVTPGGSRRAPTLAVRVGGQKVWGEFPFHQAAFIGGSQTLRGYFKQRYAGDASAFANAEIRLPISQFMLLFPTEFGIHGVADLGRVFYDGDPDDADTWHTGFGGGIWLSLFNRTQTLSATLVQGDDLLGFYLQTGFMF